MKKILVAISFFAGNIIFAQNGANVYQFLNTATSARQAGLGDAISIHDYDVSIAAQNPSLMNLEMDNRVSVNFANYLAQSQYGNISYVRDLEYGHLISVNAKYVNYGSMPRTDEFGNQNGEFSANDASIGVGYAYQFEDDWTIGGNLNFVNSKIDQYSSMAIAATGAITYHNKNKEAVSLVARNFGFQIKTFNGQKEKMPFRVDLGYTKILDNFPLAITITAHDLQKFNISQNEDNNEKSVKLIRKIADHFSFGAELFPEKAFNIRLGYSIKRANELTVLDQRNFTGLSVGFGIKISSFRLDYTHIRYNNSSNMNMFGLMLDLKELGRKY